MSEYVVYTPVQTWHSTRWIIFPARSFSQLLTPCWLPNSRMFVTASKSNLNLVLKTERMRQPVLLLSLLSPPLAAHFFRFRDVCPLYWTFCWSLTSWDKHHFVCTTMYYRTFCFSGSIQKESKDFEVICIFSKLTNWAQTSKTKWDYEKQID